MESTTYYVDIETLALPTSRREHTRPTDASMKYGNTKDPVKRQSKLDAAIKDWERGTTAALSALTGQVACIGLARGEEPVGILEGDEADILKSFWNTVGSSLADSTNRFIGFYSNSFDIPFLIRRSMLTGVTVPYFVYNEIRQYRPTMFIDVIDQWRCGDRQLHIKLETLCAAMGIAVKQGAVKGHNFGEFWNGTPEQKELARQYCKSDVDATRELAQRMGIRF